MSFVLKWKISKWSVQCTSLFSHFGLVLRYSPHFFTIQFHFLRVWRGGIWWTKVHYCMSAGNTKDVSIQPKHTSLWVTIQGMPKEWKSKTLRKVYAGRDVEEQLYNSNEACFGDKKFWTLMGPEIWGSVTESENVWLRPDKSSSWSVWECYFSWNQVKGAIP